MLSIQAVRGLPRLRAPGIVPCIISFSLFLFISAFVFVYCVFLYVCIFSFDATILVNKDVHYRVRPNEITHHVVG